MGITYPPMVVPLEKGESVSVQTLGDGYYRVQLDYQGDWVYLDLNQKQLDQLSTNIHACLLESL